MSDFRESLRRFAANDSMFIDSQIRSAISNDILDERSIAVAKLASLIAVGGAEASFSECVEQAVSAGLSSEATVAILIAIGPVVGKPRVVSAAPHLALALDIELGADSGY